MGHSTHPLLPAAAADVVTGTTPTAFASGLEALLPPLWVARLRRGIEALLFIAMLVREGAGGEAGVGGIERVR